MVEITTTFTWVLQEYEVLHEKKRGKQETSCLQNLGKVVIWKPTLTPALPEILITETMLVSKKQQGQPRFYKKVSQLMQTANKLFGNDAKCKRKDDATRSERTRKGVYMDTACKSGNRTGKQHLHLLHIPQPELLIFWLEWCWKAFPIKGPKIEQATWCLNLLPQSSRNRH